MDLNWLREFGRSVKLMNEATRALVKSAFLMTLEFCEHILFVVRMMINESESTFRSMRCL